MAEFAWFDHYDRGVPHTLTPYPEITLVDRIADLARTHGNDAALIFKGHSVTYRDLDTLSDAFAAGLVELGVKRGDRVATLLPNCPQFVIAQFGIWKVGAIVAPLNPIYTATEVQNALVECGAETMIVLNPFYSMVKSVQAKTKLKRVIATNIKEYLPPILRVLFTIAKEKKDGYRITLVEGDLAFAGMLADHRNDRRPDITVTADDPAVMLFSGGTTGTPKAAIGIHRAYIAAGEQLHAWLVPLLHEPTDRLMLPLPLFHVYGNLGVQAVAYAGRYPLVLVPNPRDIEDVLATINKTRPALFAGIPTLFIAMANHPKVQAGKVDFSSIKVCMSGSAPLLGETRKRFEEMTGGRICEGYSLTEAMMACIIGPMLGKDHVGSVGVPLPDVTVRIVDADSGDTTLPTGEVGEIIIRAPQIMQGYWNRPEETAETIREHDGDIWLHTGDLGFLDENGYVTIVDRKKDLIKVSGWQVWPREIEEVIAAHPAVAEVSVAAIPDDRTGERPKAWVVLRADQSATPDELRAWCKERLAPYKAPHDFEFRDSLPKTMIGKVLRRELTAQERAKSPA